MNYQIITGKAVIISDIAELNTSLQSLLADRG